EFAKARSRISRLKTVHGGAKHAGILRRFGQHLDLRAQRHYLGALGRLARFEERQSVALGVRQVRSRAHAERVINDEQIQLLTAHARSGALDERIRKSQRQQQNHRQAESEKNENTPATMTPRTRSAQLKA